MHQGDFKLSRVCLRPGYEDCQDQSWPPPFFLIKTCKLECDWYFA